MISWMLAGIKLQEMISWMLAGTSSIASKRVSDKQSRIQHDPACARLDLDAVPYIGQ